MSLLFDAANAAVILVDARARIIFASEPGERFLSRDNSLTVDTIHIGGSDTAGGRRLRSAIERCARPAGSSAATEFIEFPPLRVTLIPIGRNVFKPHDASDSRARPVALLLVQDAKEQHSAGRQRFAARFELTSAEAGVLTEVVAGGPLPQVARRLRVAVSTVRTHLSNIFDKTGVHRQSELVRLALDDELQLAWLARRDGADALYRWNGDAQTDNVPQSG
jgi:DNA-binding CsgD family transcriptional regulator